MLLLATGLVLLAGGVAAPPVRACSCTGTPLAEQVARADVVLTGRLVAREVGVGSDGSAPALHVLAVEEVLQGTAHAEQGVLSAASGAGCGLELAGEGPFLVVARRSAAHPGLLTADLCGGTAPLTPALLTEARVLTPGATAPLPGAAGTDPALAGRSGEWLLPAAGTAAALLLAGLLLRRRARRSRG